MSNQDEMKSPYWSNFPGVPTPRNTSIQNIRLLEWNRFISSEGQHVIFVWSEVTNSLMLNRWTETQLVQRTALESGLSKVETNNEISWNSHIQQ